MRAMCLWAIARKESIHIVRDWRSLVTSVVLPIVLIVLFGFALKFDVEHVPIAVWDQSQTPESRALLSRFTGSHYFSIDDRYVSNYSALEYNLNAGKILMGFVIPSDFARNILQGVPAKMQVLADGSDSNKATIALGYVEAIAADYSKQLSLEQLHHHGVSKAAPPIDLSMRVWYNPEMDTRYSIIPTLIPVIMMVVGAMLTSLVIAREREIGTMEQLIATPIKTNELIAGKLLPYFVIGMIDMCLIIWISEYFFSIPLNGSVVLVLAMAAIFLINSLLLGLVISIYASSQLVAIQLALVLTILPSILLSGFTAPVLNMPTAVQWISATVPARYFITILRAIYEKGVGFATIYFEALLLVAFSVVLLVASQLLLKRKRF